MATRRSTRKRLEQDGIPSPASTASLDQPSVWTAVLASPIPLYASAMLLRAVLLLYGLWQDAHSPIKYTDIDYLVFTDAARFVAHGSPPYARETYRYTPLLAWLLLPTAAAGESGSALWNAALFSSGKVLFAVADLVAGWLIEQVLRMGGGEGKDDTGGRRAMSPERARAYAAVWLLNPMVATISTRGSSEGLLGVLVLALLWAVLARRVILAGVLLGLGVHFKIYPFIYAPAIVWWMDAERMGSMWTKAAGKKKPAPGKTSIARVATEFLTADRIMFGLVSFGTFMGLNVLMFAVYGYPFVEHTYLHHVTRLDHRHNFSPYNTLLYLTSSTAAVSPIAPSATSGGMLGIQPASLAFLPQLLLSTILLPLALAKRHLPGTMLAQTFAFATFNKVCTSQYFLWYLVLLPTYLPASSLMRYPLKGLVALATWVGAQAAWLGWGYVLEFLGRSTFVPELWMASQAFFGVNCWILGVIVEDILRSG